MRNLLFYTASFVALSIPAAVMAQSAPTANWNGFYAGLSAGQATGYQIYANASDYDLEGDIKGVFIGYNFDMSPYVLGAELAYAKGPVIEHAIGSSITFPEFNFKDFIDLKGRAGYAVGDALIYAVLGYTLGNWDQDGTFVDANGMAYGIGLDYMVAPNVIVGVEYLTRDLKQSGTSVQDFDADLDTWQLRVAYKF